MDFVFGIMTGWIIMGSLAFALFIAWANELIKLDEQEQ